jgi:predicted transposase/invertase (TIGR01784 family)
MEDFPPGTDLATHPNDAFFKTIFSEPEHATAFFKSHLPQSIANRVDWTSLTVIPTSFVKSSLQQVHSDLLFSVRLGSRETLLYLIFEHQSTVDPTMPLRLLGYVGEILTQQHKAHGLPLPPMLPFVLHQGPDHWNVSTAFEDLFELPEELAADLLPFLPKFHHALLDLSRSDPAAEERDIQLRIVLHLMKLARERQLLEYFRWLAETLVDQVPDSLLGRLLLYALHADSELDARQIFRSLTTNPELEKRVMSVAEKLKAEGRVEGISQGISQGREEGLWIGKIQTLEEFLGEPQSQRSVLEALSLPELEARYLALHQDYEARFKRR